MQEPRDSGTVNGPNPFYYLPTNAYLTAHLFIQPVQFLHCSTRPPRESCRVDWTHRCVLVEPIRRLKPAHRPHIMRCFSKDVIGMNKWMVRLRIHGKIWPSGRLLRGCKFFSFPLVGWCSVHSPILCRPARKTENYFVGI